MSFRPGAGQPSNTARPARQGMAPTQQPQELLRGQSSHQGLAPDPSGFAPSDAWIHFENDGLKKMPLDGPSSTTRATASVGLLGLDDIVDDSAVDHALSDDDEAFSLDFADRFARVDSLTMPELSPLDDVASAPFRWDAAPQMAPRPGSLVFVQSPALSEAEQRRLISLAMGQGPPKGSWGAGGLDGLPAVGQATAMAPHPRPTHLQQQIQGGAAASSSSSASAPGSGQNDKGLDDGGKPKNTERAAHNDIERKYRTNLKDKIAELRDAVPALSIAGAEGEQGGGAPPKVSKGTVLTKATEYIRHLERRNRSITQQHQELSRRVQAFEQLLTPTTRANFRGPQDCNIVDS